MPDDHATNLADRTRSALTRRGGVVGAGLVLVAMTLLAYLPATTAGYIWDDDYYVYDNPTLKDAGGLGRIWLEPGATPQYYPLVHSTYWIEYRMWGAKPGGYHVVNILLHGLGAVLLWRLLSRLAVPGAWVAAAVFAVHPINVESVAWITERKNTLSGVFYLASALAFLGWRLPRGPETRGSPWRYLAALVFFLCALLSKTVTASLPAALMLVLWWKSGRITMRDVRALAPLVVLGIAFGAMTVWMERQTVGAVGAAWDHTLLERCLIAGRALWFYAGKLVFPSPLVFVYPRWHIDAGQWWQYLFPAAAVAVVVALWLARRRIGRGPLAAVLFFAGTLVPALGFFNVYPMRFSYVFDHFQYLAGIGIVTLIVGAGFAAATRLGAQGRAAAAGGSALILVVLGMLTWRQSFIYADEETIWRDTLARNPEAWIAHTNLGFIRMNQGRLAEAIDHSRASLRIYPDGADANANLGIALHLTGDHAEALEHLRAALRGKPTNIQAHYFAALALVWLGRPDEAIEHLREAIRINRRWPAPLMAAAWILATHADEAIRQPDEAVRLALAAAALRENEDSRTLDTLAAAYAAAGQFDRAAEAATRALGIARAAGDVQHADEIRARLALYERGQPYRMPAANPFMDP